MLQAHSSWVRIIETSKIPQRQLRHELDVRLLLSPEAHSSCTKDVSDTHHPTGFLDPVLCRLENVGWFLIQRHILTIQPMRESHREPPKSIRPQGHGT